MRFMAVLFTTMRVRDGEAWFFEDHVLRLEGRVPEGGLREAVANAVSGLSDARVRVTAPRDGPFRVEAAAYAPPDAPWRLRPVVASPDPAIVRRKTTARAVYDVAREGAAGCDDALLVLPDDTVLETTIANVFLIEDNKVRTPHTSAPMLAGIARAHVLEAAREEGLIVCEDRVTLADLRRAHGCFCSNALVFLHPVSAIEGIIEYTEEPRLVRRLLEIVARRAPRTRIIL